MTVPGEVPRYPAISAADKLSTPLSTPMTRVRVRLRGVCRNNAAWGIPAATSAAVVAAVIRLTPSRSEDVWRVFNPSSAKRWYEGPHRTGNIWLRRANDEMNVVGH